ncbi:hypothetical protein Poli38472_003386 [Pythium oligandrum]|uniref:PH domain-containing protein n=1 Tax=Pythium oligandrum TaxID=41045 RepID=A0A8K1C6S5_PYTOL|nr:hypothetical protein Poli38472_003386 [Pythium oligandrum]|eukprot:TMW57461.1 hypothetical protein Poli38472_003386 [Pythium oligandrum]
MAMNANAARAVVHANAVALTLMAGANGGNEDALESPRSATTSATSEMDAMAVEDVVALVSNGRVAAATKATTKPKLKISESGRFEDQFHHAHEASRAMGVLKSRAYHKQSENKETTRARKKSVNVNGRDVEQFSDADIVFAGYLVKQGSFWKTWRRRYFILRRDIPVLAYYSSQENLVKLGEIPVDATTKVEASPTDAFPNRFIVDHPSRKLVLVADEGADKVSLWIQWIRKCVATRVVEAQRAEERNSIRLSVAQRMSANGSQLEDKPPLSGPPSQSKPPLSVQSLGLPPAGSISLDSPHTSKIKRHSTDSRVIQAAADQSIASREEDKERERFIRYARLKSADTSSSHVDSYTVLSNKSELEVPRPRLFRSYSAGSVLSSKSMSFESNRAHDDSGLPVMARQHRQSSDYEVPPLDPDIRARNLSLPSFRSGPSVEFAVSVGCRGAQDVGLMVVAATMIVPEQGSQELARTEMQGTLSLRACGGDFYVRDFTTLISVPRSARHVLQFEIFSIESVASEQLSAQQSLGFVRISPLDLLLSRDSTIVLECRRSRYSPSKQVHFLVLDRIVPTESLNLGHSYLYAKRNFIADIVPVGKRKASTAQPQPPATEVKTEATLKETLSYEDMIRGEMDSVDASHLFITEELSASYCSISVAVAYMKLIQGRNKRRMHDAQRFIAAIEEKYNKMPSSPNSQTESAEIINLHAEMIEDGHAKLDHYAHLYEAYVACEDYYIALQAMLEEGKEPGITGSLKRSTQKKDKLTEFMATNLNCHVVRARRISLTASQGAKDRETRGSSTDELVHAVITHGCPAAHCLGFKEGGLRKLQQTLAQDKGDERLIEKIEQRQDIVRCQILAITAAAFLTAVGLAASELPEHQERLQLMCQTGLLLNIESLLSTIKNEKGMIEDMAEGVNWVNSSVSLQVVQSMETESKLKSAKCIGITSAESGDSVVATFALPPGQFSVLPAVLRQGHALKVHAVLFTQGVNEMQSVANTMLDTSLQDDINVASAHRLLRFFDVYRTHVKAMNPPVAARVNDLLEMETQIKILVEKLNLARKSHVQKKNVNILIESSDLCRRLGAVRTTCCKSGKDRTAMSATLECSRILVDTFHVKQGVHLTNAMRERGVRRVNVLANTGKDKFAFNSLQLKYLPDCYRPPVVAADSHVVS